VVLSVCVTYRWPNLDDDVWLLARLQVVVSDAFSGHVFCVIRQNHAQRSFPSCLWSPLGAQKGFSERWPKWKAQVARVLGQIRGLILLGSTHASPRLIYRIASRPG
jgi:hypothetical protein